jgi:hypothetical protein
MPFDMLLTNGWTIRRNSMQLIQRMKGKYRNIQPESFALDWHKNVLAQK